MKNKNLLAENMLRFRSKNLSETTKRKIVKLAEIITEQDVKSGNVEQGRKETWDFGYRPGEVISGNDIGPDFPDARKKVDFDLISSELFYTPSETPGNKPVITGNIVLKNKKTNKPSTIRIYLDRGRPKLQYIGKNDFLKQSVFGAGSGNNKTRSEFLNNMKTDYMNRAKRS